MTLALAPLAALALLAGEAPWWRSLGDEKLAAVVEMALADNGDLAAARARALASDEAALLALSPTLPALSLDVAGSAAPFSSLGFQFGGLDALGGGAAEAGDGEAVPLAAQLLQVSKRQPPALFGNGSALLAARVQLDAGRSFMSWRAARADAAADGDDAEARALALAAEVAGVYLDLVVARAQRRLLERQIALNREVLSSMDLRFSAGEASGLDVLQQRQSVAALEALLPPVEAEVRVLAQELAVLAGRAPDTALDVGSELPERAPPPSGYAIFDVVEGRPEVRAGAARLEAAAARETSTWLAFLPSVGLSVEGGWQAFVVDEPRAQGVWGAGASLSLPLLSGGQRWAALRQAERAEEAARSSLRQLRLVAMQRVDAARARHEELSALLVAARAQLVAAELALEVARERYALGLSDYQSVQLSLQTTLQAELAVLSARRQLAFALLAWHEAVAKGAGGVR